MARPQLSAEPRTELGKKVSQLRRNGRLPAVVYGAGRDSQPVSLDLHEFEQLRRHTGRNAVLDLTIVGDGKPQPVLLQAIQEHPVNRHPIHVDLLVVNMEEERTVDVPIVYVGDAPAVSRLGGVLLHLREAVSVRAKPDDLPSGIELDISGLDSFEAVLHVSDMSAPEGVTFLTDAEEAVARVQPPRVEEELPVSAAEEGVEAEGEAGEAEAAGEESAESAAEESSES